MPLMDQESSAALTGADASLLRHVRGELCIAPVQRGFTRESAAHQVNHRDADHGFGAVRVGFVVAGAAGDFDVDARVVP